MNSPMRVVLMLGGNFPETADAFNEAKKLISNNMGAIIIQSSLYKTAPWNPTHSTIQSDFLNQVLLAVTSLSPIEVMTGLQKIEYQLGRVSSEPNGPRLIDIDLLFYEHLVMVSDTLTIPHPRLHLRKFNLVPLNEILPWFRHPVFEKTINQLLKDCVDELGVEKCH